MKKHLNSSSNWTPQVQKKRSPFAPRPFSNEYSRSSRSPKTDEPQQIGARWNLTTMYGQGSTHSKASPSEPDQPLLSPKADEPQQLGAGWDLTKMSWHKSSANAYSGIPDRPLQAKLQVGAADDPYEREADRVAAQVVDQIHLTGADQPLLQSPEQISRTPEVQRSLLDGGEASSDLESAINRSRGSGQPLDAGLQESMGQAMGADFSQVRVHTGTQADALNQSIQAKAFTTGQDVFFRQGEYQPGSRSGQKLIAHELTHVVQQGTSAIHHRTNLQQSNVLQMKRTKEKVKETEGMDKEDVTKAEKDYDNSLIRGEKLKTKGLDWYQKKKNATPPKANEDTKKDIRGKGYKTFWEIDGTKVLIVTQRGKSVEHLKEGLVKSLEETFDVEDLGTDVMYYNVYEASKGVLHAYGNWANYDDEIAKSEKLPDRVNNSEIFWYQYLIAQEAYQSEKKEAAASLSSIRRSEISNAETLNTIKFCDDWPTAKENGSFEITDPTKSDVWALLGTPNGNSSVWVLMQHGSEFGGIDILSVTCETTYSGKGHTYLTIEYVTA